MGENACLPSSPGPPPHFHVRHPDVYPWENFPAVRVPTGGLVVGGEPPGPRWGQMGLAAHLAEEAGTQVSRMFLDPSWGLA